MFQAYRRFSILLMMLTMIGVAGCQTIPHGLTSRQVAVLKSEGFAPTERGWEFSVSDRLLFEIDKSDVGAEQSAAIARMATNLRRVGIRSAAVEGHADDTGSESHNVDLSQRRAQSVATIMTANGFSPDGLAVRGFGDQYPIDNNRTAEGRRENRRVAIIVAAI